MNRRFALTKGAAVFGLAVLLAALIGIGAQEAQAQSNRPELPTLTLTGTGAGWNTSYYPDGRIWVPRRGANGERTLLVQVFIKNCWRSTEQFDAFPIYSFKFKVQYDSTALQFMSVEKNGPLRGPQNTPIGCLAEDFEFATDVARDVTYQSVIAAPIQNRLRGRRVMVTGISSKPLPQTGDINSPCDQRPYVELCYLKFRVIANPAANPVSARTPLIITNDTLFYNDFQIGVEKAFPQDPPPSIWAGLGGVDNFYIDNNQQEQVRDPLRPSRVGMLWVEVTDLLPKLSFTNVADPASRSVDSVNGSNGATWFVVKPITMDVGSNYEDAVNGIGTLDIDVINAVTGSRATDIVVQSDSKWLKFKSFLKGGQGEINPFPQPVREGYVPVMDKGILGTTLGQTPLGDNTIPARDLNFRIICDPNEITPEQEREQAGYYVGYLTFKSLSLDVAPVRIKVTFLYFRQPWEPRAVQANSRFEQDLPPGNGTGIYLEVRNSAPTPNRTWIVMGAGSRATDSADIIFGESVYENALQGFGARWYPKNKNGNDIYANGLNDMWVGNNQRPQATSRDIRDIYSDTTLLYWCRFNAGSPNNYPVVLSWNVDQFIPGSDLFLRDTLDGGRFNVNMRNATNIGGTRYSYTIQDADIGAFVIEYTLPRVARFPVINKGWNLLSMPVNPASTYWKDVFRNALNIPISFAQNQYQTNETNLKVGVGYFIKYSDEVDQTIAGSRVTRIDNLTHPTRLYDGWNTVGSLSDPISIEDVTLLPFGTGAFPVRESDIYGYVTDRGYQAVTTIVPGLGYWFRVNASAYLQMVWTGRRKAGVNFTDLRESVKAASTKISVADVEGRMSDIYLSENATIDAASVFELPPLPPNELFDVRFGDHSYVTDNATPIVRFQGVTYPVTLEINNPARNYTVVDPISGEVLGSVVAGRNNVITVTKSAGSVRLMGEDADLGTLNVAVMPNPVANEGTLNVTVPASGMVTVELFNSIGERVHTLMNEYKSAGVYDVDVNAVMFPAGRYIVKVSAGNAVVTSAMTIVR
jgi:hypothetical protein